MKLLYPHFVRNWLLVFVAVWLVDATTVSAQTTHRHHKQEAADSDDDVTPSPSPARKTREKSGQDADPANSATPATAATPATNKTDNSDLSGGKSSDEKSTSADEAASPKSPDPAVVNPARNSAAGAAVSSIDPAEIEGFDAYPEPIKKLLTSALELTKRNLTYTYGSTDPGNGGMDCSGTIYYLLNQAGFTDVPRQANEQYDWVRRKSRFYAVLSKKQDNFELREMRPGDLLFWTGTYRVDRDPPVTHVMVYLGQRKKDGHRIMFGSSDGRPYDGQRRNGVSVFDFKMPAARSGDAADAATAAAPDHAPDFSGYGPIPGIPDLADAASRQTTAAKGSPTDAAATKPDPSENSSSPTPKPRRSHSPRG